MDPAAFELKPSARHVEVYGGAVLFGYQAMDALLREFMALVDRDTILVLCSALSQQPFTKRDGGGGQHFYRLRDPDGFLGMLGLQPRSIEPVMTHQYLLRFASDREAAEAGAALRALQFRGYQVFSVSEPGAASLKFGCQISDASATVASLPEPGKTARRRTFTQSFTRLT